MSSGIDWDKIKADYEARLDYEEAQGMNPVERRVKTTPKKVRTAPTSSRPTYNRDMIVRLYKEGKTPPQIADLVGCHRQTVYNNLRAAGLDLRDDRLTLPGRPKSDKCIRGHEWTEENTRQDKEGQRSCRACARIRATERRRAKRARNDAQEPHSGAAG